METGSKYLLASIYGHYTTINLKHCLKTMTNSIYFIIGGETENNIENADIYRDIMPSIEKPFEFMDKVRIFLEDEF